MDTTIDNQDSQEGGTDWELQQAEDAIAAAETPAQRALAMRRHVEAQRNMMQGVLVPMFVAMVERTMGPKIDGLRTDVQHWASESAARLGKLETRMDASEDDRADLRARLERIEHILASWHGDVESA